MNQTNKNFSHGLDCITPELVINGGKNLVTALNMLMQASYQLGHFPKPWKKENNLSKETREKKLSCVQLIQINITYIFGKIFERVILQEAVNT